MPTFENPAADADEVQTALRALAHATRSIDDPRQIYSVLGSLTSAVASLSQSLHQLAAFHDGAAKKGVWVAGDSRAGRAATYQVSWELHRAGEILHQVSRVHRQRSQRRVAHHLRPPRLPGASPTRPTGRPTTGSRL